MRSERGEEVRRQRRKNKNGKVKWQEQLRVVRSTQAWMRQRQEDGYNPTVVVPISLPKLKFMESDDSEKLEAPSGAGIKHG